MASITIRNLDDEAKKRLKVRAALRNHSMEEEARCILRAALDGDELDGATWLARLRSGFGSGIELSLPERTIAAPVDLGEA